MVFEASEMALKIENGHRRTTTMIADEAII